MFLTDNVVRAVATNLLTDLYRFLPELILCATIVLLLVLRLFRALDRWHLGVFALTMTALGLLACWDQWSLSDWQSIPTEPVGGGEVFSGMLMYDSMAVYLRLFLFAFVLLTILLTLLTGIPDVEDSADFYCLLLGSTLGMIIMGSANHLLMVYLGVEMASLPSYALAGFLKGRRQSSEAALKYVVYGGGASGVMLYGISLLAGRFGTGHLPDLGIAFLSTVLHPQGGFDLVLLLGTMFVFVGIAFKLAAVPFHFWCPDVFEGAAAEVAGFLSVASKGAALALMARLTFALVGITPVGLVTPEGQAAMAHWFIPPLALFAALTATFGNLAAYMQTNMKRLLAYSTIAHAGYMMMGLTVLSPEGAAAVLFYLVVYLFMNLGAFAVVAFLRNVTGSEDLDSYKGLILRAPVLVICLSVFLLSLLGLPPLAGFAAKFQIMQVLFEAGRAYGALGDSWLSFILYGLLVTAGVNTVISAVYYIRVLKVMVIDKPAPGDAGSAALTVSGGPTGYAAVLALAVLLVGIFWDPLANASTRGASGFVHEKPTPPPAGMRGGR